MSMCLNIRGWVIGSYRPALAFPMLPGLNGAGARLPLLDVVRHSAWLLRWSAAEETVTGKDAILMSTLSSFLANPSLKAIATPVALDG